MLDALREKHYLVQCGVTTEEKKGQLQIFVEQRVADVVGVHARAGVEPGGAQISAQQATFPRDANAGRNHGKKLTLNSLRGWPCSSPEQVWRSACANSSCGGAARLERARAVMHPLHFLQPLGVIFQIYRTTKW
jgi:hypothetical protein